MSTVDLSKAFGTAKAAAKLGMKVGDLLRYTHKHTSVKPLEFGGHYLWTDTSLDRVRQHMSERDEQKERVKQAKADGICLHCGGKPFDPDGANEDTPQYDPDSGDSNAAPEGGGDGDGDS